MLIGATLLAVVAHRGAFTLVFPRVKGINPTVDIFVHQAQRPTRIIVPLLVLLLVLPLVALPEGLLGFLKHVVDLGLIGAIGWLLIRLTDVAAELVIARYERLSPDDISKRASHTRVEVLQRVASVVLGVITLALMLMTFPSIHHLGVSLLASAGFAGLAIGMAARPTLANMIAGVQIALTQPIRIGDVVIVENEWGWIEEIGTTYVVIRIWDLRRLVVPLSSFIERPFQNWTRQSSNLLATVQLFADYTIPVEEVRQELHRVLQSTDLWDGKVWNLQVTGAREQVVELRALMSARDSGTAWDLRCYVREKLIGFLQDRYPRCLPRMRTELLNGGGLSATGHDPHVEPSIGSN